ncbi:hypothetical protein evm_000295 [Chilo suppressalis]|nr:hypothetical protein evm_000295 [Chilo suppressalis]
MPVCIVKLCKNNTSKNKKDTGITYHQFPADPVLRDRWTAIVRVSREESWWKPGKTSVICSTHFNASDLYLTKGGLKRLHKGAVPQNALILSSILPDNISKNNVVTAEPSTSIPVVNSNSIVVTAIPSTSASADETKILTSGNETPPLDDFSDIEYIFDSPRKTKLKKELYKKNILQLKHGRIIKTLREKTRRLKKSNSYLKGIIKSLKKELSKNVVLVKKLKMILTRSQYSWMCHTCRILKTMLLDT